MTTSTFSHSDLRILLRIINSRKGADFDEIVAFHKSHRWPEATADEIRAVVARFISLGLITQQDNRFHASAPLQNAFNEACRNVNDTVEEYGMLARILESPLPR